MKTIIKFLMCSLIAVALMGCVQVKRDGAPIVIGGGNEKPKKPKKAPRLDKQIKTSHKGDLILLKSWPNKADNKKKIKICMVNKTEKGKWKAMHFKDEKPPKKSTAKGKGAKSCYHYKPGYKTFFFWKYKGWAKKKVKTYSIDLSKYKGHLIHFEWVRD